CRASVNAPMKRTVSAPTATFLFWSGCVNSDSSPTAWPARGVAQPGRALRSGRRSRWFKSSHPDCRGAPRGEGAFWRLSRVKGWSRSLGLALAVGLAGAPAPAARALATATQVAPGEARAADAGSGAAGLLEEVRGLRADLAALR